MPFTGDLRAGKRVRVTIEFRGPRDATQQRRLKVALQKLLKVHNAVIRTPAKRAKKASSPRRKSR